MEEKQNTTDNESKYSICPYCKRLIIGIKQKDKIGNIIWKFHCNFCKISY